MKVVRFIFGLASFMVVWITVATLIALAVHAVFPGAGGEVLGVHWAAIPGGVVGVFAGFRVFQMISGGRPKKPGKTPGQI